MKPRIRFSPGILASGIIILLTVVPSWAQNYSHARVVRLSFVEGEVTLQRPDVQGWAEAPVNTPLQQGFKLFTGENSYAEIQFENGGAIRLGQLSQLDFTELELAPDGGKIDHVELRQGYASFHPLPSSPGESLEVGTPYGTLIAQDETRFRVDLDQGVERVEVFDGAVEEQSNLGGMTLEKDSVLVMQPGTSEPTVVSQGISKDDWDQWVDDRDALAQISFDGPAPDTNGDDASGDVYGWNDLQQYGTWSNVPGLGYGWIPNLVANGWAPYSTGEWCWYPGWGYTWIGAEPWGWLPYHYGGWEFVPGLGWVWFPGSFGTWSPAQVAWYQGPNWIGWRPRPHRRDAANACGNNCGGGVVSTSTFRHGGLLASNLMLNVNPTMGQRIRYPGIVPTAAAKMSGPAVSLSASQSPGFRENATNAPVGTRIPATMGPRGVVTSPNSAIVYDPQREGYVNGHGATTPQSSSVSPATTGAVTTTPAANPGLAQPAPVRGRESIARPAESQQPNSSTYFFAKPRPAGTVSSPSGGRPAGYGGEGSHPAGSVAPAGGFSGFAAGGGAHAGGSPAVGGGRR